MGTYAGLKYHIVFSTKERKALIPVTWNTRLYSYLGGMVRGLEGTPVAIGGMSDHVHLLLGLRPTHRISDFMRELKRQSSSWIHDEIGLRTFTWQDGYAVFSVSPSRCSDVENYIRNQAQHHKNRSARDELECMLREAEIPFDERFLE